MASAKTTQEVLLDISDKLDNILTYMAIRGLEGNTGAIIERLNGLGMGPRAIAKVAGMTENAVGLRLMRIKKAKAGGQVKAKAKAKTKGKVTSAPAADDAALAAADAAIE